MVLKARVVEFVIVSVEQLLQNRKRSLGELRQVPQTDLLPHHERLIRIDLYFKEALV
jgi:hypothetical protein